jgi:hypothetical protein
MFQGSGANKYANELLELTPNFDFEFPEELMNAIKNNWLVNLTGYSSGWFPGDLMQEHNIRLLKKMAQRRDAEFRGHFFSEVISRNIRAFINLKRFLPESVGLKKMSEMHGTARTKTIARVLENAHKSHSPHIFRAGRSFGFKARDDFSRGFQLLREGKLDVFVKRTTQDPLAVQGDSDTDCGELDLTEEEEDSVPRQTVFPTVFSDEGALVVDDLSDEGNDSEVEADNQSSEGEGN